MGGVNVNPFDAQYAGNVEIATAATVHTISTNSSAEWCFWDYTNRICHLFSTYSSTGWYQYSYDTDGNITPSGPFTLPAAADAKNPCFQGSSDGDFYMQYDSALGGYSANDIVPYTISGTTYSVGAAIATPVIAGKTLCFTFADGTDLYSFYVDTVTDLIDTGRKYTVAGGWTSLAGTALPTGVVATAAYDKGDPLKNYTRLPYNNLIHAIFDDNLLMRFDIAAQEWKYGGDSYPLSAARLKSGNSDLLLLSSSDEVNGTLMNTSDGSVEISAAIGWLYEGTSMINLADFENGVSWSETGSGSSPQRYYVEGLARSGTYLLKYMFSPAAGNMYAIRAFLIVDGEYRTFTSLATTDAGFYAEVFKLAHYCETKIAVVVTCEVNGNATTYVFNKLD